MEADTQQPATGEAPSVPPEDPSLTPPSWPTDRPKPKFDDLLKLNLLVAYALFAPDPFVRDATASGRAKVRGQLKLMVEAGAVIEIPGEGTFLFGESVATLDHFACCLNGIQKNGFSGQRSAKKGTGGLLHALDQWIKETGNGEDKDRLKANILDLQVFVKERFCQQ